MKKILAALMFLGLATTTAPGAADAFVRHFALSKSMPEADATVASPSEVRLWFTQEPSDGSLSIRLVDASGEPTRTGEAEADPEDSTVFSVSVPDPLAAGSYTVAWRAIGQDGHVVRGDFSFNVSEQ